MPLQQWLFLIVIFFANTIEAMTGFAGTMLAMPASMILLGVDEAKTMLNIVSLITCTAIVLSNRQHIDKQQFFKITGFMLLGVIIGLWLFTLLNIPLLMKLYALIIIIVALKNMFVKKNVRKLSHFAAISILISAGIIHGMFLSGGTLLIIYAMLALREKAVFRATLAAVWVALDSGILINQAIQGFVTPKILLLTAATIIPLMLAIALGNYLHKKIQQQHFLMLTYVLVLISGLFLFFK